MDPKIRYDVMAQRVNDALPYYFPMMPGAVSQLYEAAHYSLLAGGKRLRPVLLLECARMFGCPAEDAMPFACALEMIHTYSLIHDDLPSMDNDSLRRGQPTSHIVFGEAAAILAGDALLTEAFEIALDEDNRPGVPARTRLRAAHLLARAAGITGMAGGQMIDIDAPGLGMSLDDVVHMHLMKTGALLCASVEIGALMAGASDSDIRTVRAYARLLALAFQARDDLLDATGTVGEMGKKTGRDAEAGRVTLVKMLGEDGCAELIKGLSAKACETVARLPDNGFLLWLTEKLSERKS